MQMQQMQQQQANGGQLWGLGGGGVGTSALGIAALGGLMSAAASALSLLPPAVTSASPYGDHSLFKAAGGASGAYPTTPSRADAPRQAPRTAPRPSSAPSLGALAAASAPRTSVRVTPRYARLQMPSLSAGGGHAALGSAALAALGAPPSGGPYRGAPPSSVLSAMRSPLALDLKPLPRAAAAAAGATAPASAGRAHPFAVPRTPASGRDEAERQRDGSAERDRDERAPHDGGGGGFGGGGGGGFGGGFGGFESRREGEPSHSAARRASAYMDAAGVFASARSPLGRAAGAECAVARPRAAPAQSAPAWHQAALLELSQSAHEARAADAALWAHDDEEDEEDGSRRLADELEREAAGQRAQQPAQLLGGGMGGGGGGGGGGELMAARAAPTPTRPPIRARGEDSGGNALAARTPARTPVAAAPPAALETRPHSRAALAALPDAALAAVPDFEIFAAGLGAVRWAGATDVRELLHELERLVVFAPRSVEVYPEGCRKPAVGFELNRPATVTLHAVLPLHRGTGAVLRDERSCALFEAKLVAKLAAFDAKAEHVAWDRRTGAWQFRVDHF
jgi:hypothetical protein